MKGKKLLYNMILLLSISIMIIITWEYILALEQVRSSSIINFVFHKERQTLDEIALNEMDAIAQGCLRTPLDDTGCLDKMCVNLITTEEKKYHDSCTKKTIRLQNSTINGTCHFLERAFGCPPVALSSMPGSGNTWMRGLLEQATGLCTGIYGLKCDIDCISFVWSTNV